MLQSLHAVCPNVLVNKPTAQELHISEFESDENLPGVQSLHADEATEADASLNFPASHFLQVLFVVSS